MSFGLDSLKAGGIVQSRHQAMIGLMSVADQPGVAGTVLGVLARRNINVHFLVESSSPDNRSHFVICVDELNLDAALRAVTEIKDRVEAEKITHRRNVALVSVFGPHFRDVPGAACLTCAAISAASANILAISTSFSSVTCVIDENDREKVVKSLQEAFAVADAAVCTAADGLSKRTKH